MGKEKNNAGSSGEEDMEEGGEDEYEDEGDGEEDEDSHQEEEDDEEEDANDVVKHEAIHACVRKLKPGQNVVLQTRICPLDRCFSQSQTPSED